MTRRATAILGALALALVLTAGPALAQAGFDIPFELKAAGKKLAAGAYAVAKTPEGGLVLRQASTGREVPLPVLERIPRPEAAEPGPRLVFDEVGDFAPSYTEYITVYVLAEVWLPGEDGYRIHLTKGAHKTRAVAGQVSK